MQFLDPDDEDSDQMKFIQKLFKQNKVKIIRRSADDKKEKTPKLQADQSGVECVPQTIVKDGFFFTTRHTIHHKKSMTKEPSMRKTDSIK